MRVVCDDTSEKPYKVMRDSDQAVSKESFWTRKSANIAMKKGRGTSGSK